VKWRPYSLVLQTGRIGNQLSFSIFLSEQQVIQKWMEHRTDLSRKYDQFGPHLLKGGPIGINSILKNSKNFSERNAKNFF